VIEENLLINHYKIIEWNGEEHFLSVWNKNQSLKSAYAFSCVWFYQIIAKRIGENNYAKYFKVLDYGNQFTVENITTFWLTGGGGIKITPLVKMYFCVKFTIVKFRYQLKSIIFCKILCLRNILTNINFSQK
jgi:beta-lactamase class D